jgi:hypothetical protein
MTGGHQSYAELTGRQLPSEQLDLYRLRWDLADLCSYGSWFCRPHEATPDIQLGWQGQSPSARVCPLERRATLGSAGRIAIRCPTSSLQR